MNVVILLQKTPLATLIKETLSVNHFNVIDASGIDEINSAALNNRLSCIVVDAAFKLQQHLPVLWSQCCTITLTDNVKTTLFHEFYDPPCHEYIMVPLDLEHLVEMTEKMTKQSYHRNES